VRIGRVCTRHNLPRRRLHSLSVSERARDCETERKLRVRPGPTRGLA
jgi:hypothetical protein